MRSLGCIAPSSLCLNNLNLCLEQGDLFCTDPQHILALTRRIFLNYIHLGKQFLGLTRHHILKCSNSSPYCFHRKTTYAVF